MREIYEIVGALEGQGVRRATRDGGAILLGALATAVQAQEAALAADDADGWVQADHRFHELLREGSANRRLRDLIHQFDGRLQQARVATIHVRARPQRSTDDHRAILDAIRAGDEDEAVRVHAAHRRRADAEMLTAIEEYARITGDAAPREHAGHTEDVGTPREGASHSEDAGLPPEEARASSEPSDPSTALPSRPGRPLS
jgi:DNA-binding GntR family transcriptional regulator